MTTQRVVAPYGSWRSPISIADIVGQSIALAEPWIDGQDVYWLEGRPTDAGRRVLVRARGDDEPLDVVGAPFNVRSRVHEYGGGSYTVRDGTIVFSNFTDGRLYRLSTADAEPQAITWPGAFRYADLRIAEDPSGSGLVVWAVREDHTVPGRVRNEIVKVPLAGGRPSSIPTGTDFVAAPRPGPGGRLAWLSWNHPDMPWDAARLRVLEPAGRRVVDVAGGAGESIVQPVWDDDGSLVFASDRTGFWNPYRWVAGGGIEPELPSPAEIEFADPAWVFDRSSFAFLPDGSTIAIGRSGGRDRLYRLRPGRSLDEVPTPFTELDALRAGPAGVVAIVGRASESAAIVRLDPSTGLATRTFRRASTISLPDDLVSLPEPIEFPTTDGATARALYYAPRHPAYAGPPGDRPPLVVVSHGGPTSNASTGLDLSKQLLTSRGIAVVDVDYRGSTGYGRAYRDALNGRWGTVDVDDCVAAAQFLVARGDVDPDRLAISGASAGGYTTLCALVFRDVFRAGISWFGVADLALLQTDSHKFELRYSDNLVAPWPEGIDTYRERSPIHYLDRLSCPVLILQGLDDRVVPPSQARAIVEALEAKGLPYAYIAFEGEGHGFRAAANQRRSYEADLSFLAQVFGFELADEIEPVVVHHLESSRRRGEARTA